MKTGYSTFIVLAGTILVCAFNAVTSSAINDDVVSQSLNFLGIGYNILTGNPDGDAGVDPGLLVTRRILELTHTNGDYHVPDQVVFASRDNCMKVVPNTVIYGSKSYQRALKREVTSKGDIRDIFSGYEFSKSDRYQQMKVETELSHNVYAEKRYVCNRGQARYMDELAAIDRYPLSRSFVADACALPTSFSVPEYMTFLDEWGTGVVIEVEIGKKVIDRFISSDAEFVQFVRQRHFETLQNGGSYQGHASSVVVDMDALFDAMTVSEIFGKYSETIGIGSDDHPEPTAIKIIGMKDLFHEDFWQLANDYVTDGLCEADFMSRMPDITNNVQRALVEYSVWKNAQPSIEEAIQVPVTWPYGTYALPMPQVGCPLAHFYWRTGSRYQDTENFLPNNYWSDPCHLQGPYHKASAEMNFCSKTVAEEDDYNWSWPQGAYCIFRRDGQCPSGFDDGWVLWDDTDTLNSNRLTGEVPDGVYDRDTLMEICCREDGSVTDSIILPTDDNFFLFQKSPAGCQQVVGMNINEEYFRWDGEDDRIVLRNYVGGSTPYNSGKHSDHQLHYCYYYTGSMD